MIWTTFTGQYGVISVAKNGGHSALVYRDALQKTHGSSNMLSCLYLCIHVYSLDVNGNAEFNVYIYIYIVYRCRDNWHWSCSNHQRFEEISQLGGN